MSKYCLFLSFIALALGDKLVEYKFGTYFGQVFYDSSGNGNHGQNGDSIGNQAGDTRPNDRGAYFRVAVNSYILLPPNEIKSTTLTISSTFSIVMWIYPYDSNDYYLTYRRLDASNYFYLQRMITTNYIQGRIVKTNYDSTVITGTKGIPDQKWSIVALISQGATSSFYSNGVLDFTITQTSSYSETGTYLHYIGYKSISFEGFVWSFYLYNEAVTLANFFTSSHTVGNCLVSTCPASCQPAIVENGVSYCISELRAPYKSGINTDCGTCTYGCTANTNCLNCDSCSSEGCYFIGNNMFCLCNYGTLTGNTCVCASGKYLSYSVIGCADCYSECSTCSSQYKCDTCVDGHSNKHSTIGCFCNTGYYNTTALINGGTCLKCYGECLTCSAALICLTCKDAHSIIHEAIGCKCSSGYYNTTALISGGTCLECYGECLTCSEALICLTCKDTHSISHEVIGCKCSNGYYNTSALISGGTCLQCYGECLTCSVALICSTCKDLQSISHATVGCICKSGYYNVTALIYGGSCLKCYGECSACTEQYICNTCIDNYSTKHATIGCTCNSGYYNTTGLIDGGSCLKCYGECSTCSGQYTCNTCVDTYSTKHATIGCTCNSGYYNTTGLIDGGSCLKCYGECLTCSNQYACNTCIDTYSTKHATIGCTCNSGYYNTTGLIDGGSCLKCYAECLTCSAQYTCDTCTDSYSIKHTTIGCVCNSGYFNTSALINGGTCLKCYDECLTCSSQYTCETCIDTHSYGHATIGCICNSGFYNITALVNGGTCLQCYGECLTCSEALKCLTCKDLQSDKHNAIGCSCKSGYYNITTLIDGGSCLICYGECLTCSNQYTCDLCLDNHSTSHGTIGCVCENGYYNTTALINGGSCLKCYEECLTCSQELICDTCNDPHSSKHASIGCTCNSEYLNTTALILGGKCFKCYGECLTCSVEFLCDSCADSNSIKHETIGCTCKERYYNSTALINGGICLACYGECLNCSSQYACDACIDPHSTEDNIKGCTCEDGYYNTTALVNGGTCLECYGECLTCENQFICDTCAITHSIKDKTIGCICEDGYYNSSALIDGGTCLECYEECAKCSSQFICDYCVDSNAEKDSIKGCKCKNGYYNITTINNENTCLPCYQDCLTCDNSLKCLTCIDQFSTPHKTIGCECLSGYYNISDLIDNGACLKCEKNCLTCESPEKCLDCQYNFMNVQGGTCDCPVNSVLINENCTADEGYFIGENSLGFYTGICHQSCKTCNGEKDSDCVTCANNLLKFKDLCNACGEGLYLDNYNCSNCPADCLTCTNDSFCVTCADPLKAPVSGTCFYNCAQGFYDSNGICTSCPKFCLKCSNLTYCEKCNNDMTFSDGECKCSQRFKMIENECIENLFQASLSVSKNNLVDILFTEPASVNLKVENFTFEIQNRNDFQVNLLKNSLNQELIFSLVFSNSISAGTKLDVYVLVNGLKSVNGAYLDNYKLSGELFEFSIIDTNTIANIPLSATQSSVTAGVSSTICSSILSNPAAAWTLLNTIQFLALLPLSALPLPAELVKFFKGIGEYNLIPNLFDKFYPSNSSSPPYSEAKKYGISTSIFIINIGPYLVFFLIVTFLWPLAFFLSKCASGKFASKLIKLLGNYKFSFFLRFWTQMYLEIGIYAIIQLKAIGVAFTPILTFFFGYFSDDKIKAADREFFRIWGSFYLEFKNDKGFWSSQYYFFYFSRRLAYLLAQIYLNKHLCLQGSIHIFFSLVLIGFLLIYRPFKSNAILASNLISELGTFIVILLSYGFYFDIKIKTKELFEIIIMFTTLSTIFLQSVISSVVFVETLIIIWKKYLKKRNLKIARIAENEFCDLPQTNYER